MIKNLSAMQETLVQSLSGEDPLEREMATHSSILAWRIPWTEEPDRPQSMGSQRVGHKWATNTHRVRKGPLLSGYLYFDLFITPSSPAVEPHCCSMCAILFGKWMDEKMKASLERLKLMWTEFCFADTSFSPLGCGIHRVRDFCRFYSLISPCNKKTSFSEGWPNWRNSWDNMGSGKNKTTLL